LMDASREAAVLGVSWVLALLRSLIVGLWSIHPGRGRE
jgi:hypothetical protein